MNSQAISTRLYQVGCSTGKFFCSRKKKFGLNCQAVCDVHGRILDLMIVYSGSTSDCLALEGMSLFCKLGEGVFASGLCLFGNITYINSPYLATPYAGVSGGGQKCTTNVIHNYKYAPNARLKCSRIDGQFKELQFL